METSASVCWMTRYVFVAQSGVKLIFVSLEQLEDSRSKQAKNAMMN